MSALLRLQEAAAAQGREPTTKRARLDAAAPAGPAAAPHDAIASAAGADSLMAQVARYERRLWDRNSALSVPGKTFSRTAQLAKEALYDQQRRPEAPRSAARPSHRVSALRLAQNLGTAANGCNFAGFAMNDALIQRCLTDIAISVECTFAGMRTRHACCRCTGARAAAGDPHQAQQPADMHVVAP